MDTVYPAGRELRLGPDDVHVWFADLNRLCSRLEMLESYLGADERARANRYYFRPDRNRFICNRGALRELLGIYSQQHPACVRFGYNPSGKPALIPSEKAVPNFNCSRSGDVAIFAFASEREVGIDIEQVEDDEDFLNIALQYYTHSEIEILQHLDPGARMNEFFCYWTRREAFLKATGQGLSHRTAELDVSPQVIRDSDGTSCWTINTFDLVPGYASSLASSGTGQTPTFLDYGDVPRSAFDLPHARLDCWAP